MRGTQSAKGPSSKAAVILAKSGTVSRYPENSLIYSQGKPCDAIFYIQKGVVMLAVKSKHHRTAVISVLGAGSFFNELCLLNYPNHVSEATAITSSSILAISKEEMIRLLRRGHDVSTLFASCLLSSIMRFREDLADVLVNSSELRLARALLRLVDLDKQHQGTPRLPRISQQVLSEMIGTTRPRTSLFMNRFKKQGFISYNGRLEVHESLRTFLRHH